MEQRLIDANALLQVIPSEEYCARMAIQNAPTIDAVPVVHGHWERGSAWYPPICSNCNEVPLTPGYVGDVIFYNRYFRFCPHCGAKMVEVKTWEN